MASVRGTSSMTTRGIIALGSCVAGIEAASAAAAGAAFVAGVAGAASAAGVAAGAACATITGAAGASAALVGAVASAGEAAGSAAGVLGAAGVAATAGALAAGALLSAGGVLSRALTMLAAATIATVLIIANFKFIFLGCCFPTVRWQSIANRYCGQLSSKDAKRKNPIKRPILLGVFCSVLLLCPAIRQVIDIVEAPGNQAVQRCARQNFMMNPLERNYPPGFNGRYVLPPWRGGHFGRLLFRVSVIGGAHVNARVFVSTKRKLNQIRLRWRKHTDSYGRFLD